MVNSFKKNIYFLLCAFSTIISLSQSKYSSDLNYLKSKPESVSNLINDYRIAYPDTSVKNLHNYVGRNFMGNIGMPQPDYILSYKSSPLGFNLYKLPYTNDIFSQQQVEYFRTKGPYASLTGISGSKNDQMFRLLFSHTIKKKLNITLKFNRFGCQGFYAKQQTFTNNFYLSTNYTNTSKRFGFYGYLLINKVKHQENGGIKYDTLFTQEPLINKQLLSVNLSNAKRENRQMTASFNPWVKLNKGPDSVGVSHYVDYKFNYSGSYYQYLDYGAPYDGYYNTFYLDTTKTNDSTHLRQFFNQINYTLKLNEKGLGFSLGYSHDYSILHQHNDSVFSNQQAYATLFFRKLILKDDSSHLNSNKSISSNLFASTIVDGPNKNDLKIEWKSRLEFGLSGKGLTTNKSNTIYLNILSEQRHPDLIYNYWHANNFSWDNNFKPVNFWQAQIGAKNYRSGLSFNILWHNYFNYLYFDANAKPQQLKTIISNWQYNVNFDKVVFKHLGLRANMMYQTTNNKTIIKMPALAASGSIYYTGNLFKNALQLQIGAQADWYQAFEANAYMPATNTFYIQDKKTVGNYPFVDVFLNARIKPVQFFVKVENVMQGLTGSNYYFVPGYIQPDRSFRFGITWLFFD